MKGKKKLIECIWAKIYMGVWANIYIYIYILVYIRSEEHTSELQSRP